MKVALVHDTLTEFGGAERVLQSLLRLYPDAHVYTAYFDKRFVRQRFPSLAPKKIHASVIQKLRLSRWGYLLQFLAPMLWRRFNFEKYNVVISSSSFFLSNTIRVARPIHIQYIHCLPKNIFDLALKVPTQKYIHYERYLATQYESALKKGDCVVANSRYTQHALGVMFSVSSQVIYPPITIPKKPVIHRKGSYYLTVSRLDETKELEIVICACSSLSVPLKIVGTGSDELYVKHLHRMAGPTIEFLGFLEDAEVNRLYRGAKAFLFSPRAEDFGMAPAEAMANGVPVIAYRGGGVVESVKEGMTGAFFHSYTPESLMDAIQKFSPKDYHVSALQKQADKFSERIFHTKIKNIVDGFFKNGFN